MAQSGFTPIQLYRSATPGAVPLAADLAAGELALNTADEKLFFENASGAVVSIDAANGTVTSVALSGGTTGLTVSGSPITTSGTITLAGTLAVANGGTGQTTFTNGQLLIGNTTGNTLAKATLTAGTNISITNGAGAITINSTDQFVGTVTSVALSGGTTGLTVSGSPITTSGTVTLAGTLAVANGGTGVTSSTGTVAVVLSNSPTLVTPILGAASATSIANGLGAVGTPSYTFTGDLNTGMFSPIADTVAVSTNGAERMRINSAGNVGIGTTNPLFPLNVNGEVRGTKFTSDAGSQSLASGADLAVLTLTGFPGPQVYQVVVGFNSNGNSMTVALITVGTDGSGGRLAALTKLVTSVGSGTDITVTNAAGTSTVNVEQNSGVTQLISYSIMRLL